MGKVNEYSLQLLEDWGDLVDIHYTQFLEVSFFLKVAADHSMAVAFIKRKVPMLTDEDIRFLIGEVVGGYQNGL